MDTQLRISPPGNRNGLPSMMQKSIPLWNKSNPTYSDMIRTTKLMNCESGQIDSVSTFGNLIGTNKWIGGVLAPNGCIYGIPYSSTTILKINTSNDVVTMFGSLVVIGGEWHGGASGLNGCIYGIPRDSTSILKILSPQSINPNLPLSRLYNKF